jgi:GrpB-like predicted nucleotidyltransferase (UPF0157 family)
LVGYSCRLSEDFVSVKIRRWQKGVATPFDYSLLRRVHRVVLTRLSTIPGEESAKNATTMVGVGLHNSRVAVEGPNPAWGDMAGTESTRLRKHLDPLVVTIHHIGSTSVPGLPAKPIIDLAIGFEQQILETRLPEVINRMQESGYRYLGDWKKRGGYFFEKADGQVRTHAVQVHRADSDDLRRLLRFRDLMRSDPKLVQRYSEVKLLLASVLAHQRGLYFWYKSHWLNDLLLVHHGPNAWGEWWVSARYPTMIQFIQRSIVRTLTGGRSGRHPMAV